MANEEESESNGREGPQRGLISNKRDAIVAVVITFIFLASAFRSAIARVPQRRWLFEPIRHSYLFGRSASIALSIFFWCFVAWILFWFYRAVRDRNERFLVGGFAIAYVIGVVSRFLSPFAQTNLKFVTIAAFLVSLASSLTVLTKVSSRSKIAP